MKESIKAISRIPIINYHKIEENYDIGITTRTPEQFKDDLEFLKRNHFQTITFNDLLTNEPLPQNPIIITFDDAYQSFYNTAYPLLKEYGYSAVIYAPLDYLGEWNDWDVQYYGKKYRHISKDELLEVHKNGMEIGSHTFRHLLLTALNDAELEREIRGSKEWLEDRLNEAVVSIGYPFSRFNDKVIAAARKAGYLFGTASLFIRPLKEEDRLLALKRSNIYRIDGRSGFAKKVKKENERLLLVRDWLIQKGGLATGIHQFISGKAGKQH
jgi:peptidoglycan/xylan/chitin deacetylase (PgdA/CDA1 family)